jgi:lambda family phage tail tape measure protein
MADIDVTLAIDEKPALKALKNIENSVKSTEKSFNGLGKVIGALAIGNFIQDTYSYAKSTQNMSMASLSAVNAQENMGRQLNVLRQALLKILQPLNDFVATIELSTEKVIAFWNMIKVFLVAITAMFVGGKLLSGVKSIVDNIKILGSSTAALLNIVKPLAIQFKELFSVILGSGQSALSRLLALALAVGIALRKLSPVALGLGALYYGNKIFNEEKPQYGPFEGRIYGQETQDMMENWPQQQANIIANMERMRETDIGNLKLQNKQLLDQLKIEEQILGIEEKHIPFIQARGQLLQQRDAMLNDINNRILNMSDEQVAAGGKGVLEAQKDQVTRMFERQSVLVSDALLKIQNRQAEVDRRRKIFEMGEEQARAYEEERRAIEEFIDTKNREIEARNRSREAMTGWVESWKQFKDDATDAAQMVRDQFNSVFSNIDNALDNFVRTGKLSFKDLITSISRDLASLGLRNAFRQMVGSGFDLFGQHFSGAFAGGFANGGYIPAGKFGVVGERGPEFVSGPAQITPMNGGGTVINNYISAMDAKSVAQLFAENRKTLLGVTEQAKKELNYKGMR